MLGSSNRMGSIQLLRFVAAAMVVVYHAIVYIGPGSVSGFPEALYEYAWIGATGVHIFFIISRFIMVLTSRTVFAAEGATRRFITRRFIRIYPIYWIVALLYVVSGSVGVISLELNPTSTAFSLLLLPGYGPTIISPGWSLVYEVYFYLVFAFILLLPRRAALWTLTIFFVASVTLGVTTNIDQLNALFKHMTNVLLIEFLAGALLAAWYLSGRMPEQLSNGRYLASVLATAILLFMFAPTFQKFGIPDVVGFGVPSFLLVVVAVASERTAKIRATIARFAWLGDSSYAVYLVHVLVIQLLLPPMQPQIFGWGGLLVATVLAIVASIVTGLVLHLYLEAPLLIRLRRHMGRSANATPIP
jgi:exopolysaccharide production protein ExoZ